MPEVAEDTWRAANEYVDRSGPGAVIEGDFVEGKFVPDQPGAALAVRETKALAAWTPTFAVAVDEAIERKREKNRFFREVMDEGLHYGKIPGAGDKPALLKPGAEMLLSNMGLSTEFEDESPAIVDLEGLTEHGNEAYIHYHRRCTVYRQTGPTMNDRIVIARASGSCSSREKKYRWRDSQRKCPDCGKPAIIAGKKEYGGGFICFKKKDGCGAKFGENDARITGQTIGQVPNPDIADLDNTILKMADKRALVAATLVATGCSDIFTQDIEDQSPPADEPAPSREDAPPPEPRLPKVAELLHRAQGLGICTDGAMFAEWLRDRVPGCEGAGKGWTPNDGQKRAIIAELERIEQGQRQNDEPAPPAESQPFDRRNEERRIFAICADPTKNVVGKKIDDGLRHQLMQQRYAKTSMTQLTDGQVIDFAAWLQGQAK